MNLPIGVYIAYKKDGSLYYRASITHLSKHISLGSYDTCKDAHTAYLIAKDILYSNKDLTDYDSESLLSYDKWVILINYRDNNIYIKTPIYLSKNHFEYHLTPERYLIFDIDDLFYYSNHKIMQRNGYLFVADYGMQTNILSRYGIKNYAVEGRDFTFANGDCNDYRYKNIIIINKYNGVTRLTKNGLYVYRAKIHINGDYIIGTYSDEIKAAIAYNKAIDILKEKGINKNYTANYIPNLSAIQYASIYNNLRISKKLREL
ncbi:MAG: hypothetical protein E7252_06155 [Lachnospira sp.]|nr:hypothetical protein [Lachnospira sp.]